MSFTLLAISGSLRSGSVSTAILETLRDKLAGTADITVFGLHDIPLYNGDLDGPHLPASVAQFKGAVASADGLILCTPEYNYGMSGVLKNALDWVSRPAFQSPAKGKPVVILSSAPGQYGGARAHQQVRDTMSSMLARVVTTPPVAIPGVYQKIADGRLTDADSLQFAVNTVHALIDEIHLLKLAAQA